MASPDREPGPRRKSVTFSDDAPAGGSAPRPCLWGAEAVQALLAPRELREQVADEDALLEAMRSAVGPYATEAALRYHLRNAHAKLHWAVNGYLRESVLARCSQWAGGADYEPKAAVPASPRRGSAGASGSGSAAAAAPEFALPAAVWCLVLAQPGLSAADVRAAAQVCRALRDAAASQPMWEALYGARWGAVALAAARAAAGAAAAGPVAEGGGGAPLAPLAPPPFCWRRAFRERARAMGDWACPALPACSAHLAPVVYGFPSAKLVEAQRRGHVVLGGDYLVDRDPVWMCLGCSRQFERWPWAPGADPPPLEPDAQRWAPLPLPSSPPPPDGD